jgi:hypothetical protein
MAGKKISKTRGGTIREILFAHTASHQVRKLAMLEDYFVEEEEEEEEEEEQPASAEVAINNGQRNQPNFSAFCVLRAAKERTQCARCDVGLCVVPCFAECRTKVNL